MLIFLKKHKSKTRTPLIANSGFREFCIAATRAGHGEYNGRPVATTVRFKSE